MLSALGLKGKFRVIKTDSKTGKVLYKSPFYKNLIVDGTNTGFNLILDRLNSDNTYSLNITHLDIGDNNTAPALSDTTLVNALYRTTKTTGSVAGSSLTLRFFFADGDLADDTYYEVGMFVDGTSSVDTGKLFCRSIFGSAYTKATGEDTTIEWVLSKVT